MVIGEKINPTGCKKLAAALQEGNMNYVRDLTNNQVAAGADVLDVNVGVPGVDDVPLSQQVVKMLADEYDVSLCLDSPNPAALAAALPLFPGRMLVNSVNGEEKSLSAVLPLVKEHGAIVISLTMDENSIPNDSETLWPSPKKSSNAPPSWAFPPMTRHRSAGFDRWREPAGSLCHITDHRNGTARVRLQCQYRCQQCIIQHPNGMWLTWLSCRWPSTLERAAPLPTR